MTSSRTFGQRLTSVVLAMVIMVTMLPLAVITASAADLGNPSRVADPSTMNDWTKYFPKNGNISTENAGAVWMDKSVFTDAAAFGGLISKDSIDSFLVALSVMASNMSITGMSNLPTDTILVLDVSGSMNSGNNDVAEELVDAANESIKTLLATSKYNRVGVVLYSGPRTQGGNASNNDAVLILPLDRYTAASNGEYLHYSRDGGDEIVEINGDVRIEGTNRAPSSVSKVVEGATYIQKGVILAMNQFIANSNSVTVNDPTQGTLQRKPIVVLMSDGAPTVGSTNFTEPTSINLGDGTSTNATYAFVSQLSAAYAKAKIEEKYGVDALFYTLGLGISNDRIAISVMDPDNENASTAVDDFWNDIQTNWRGQITFAGYNHVNVGETVSLGGNRSVTKISTPLEQNYVDRYFAANGTSGSLSAELVQAFKDIVNEIQLQSAYFPTLIAESENLSGYVSFVDRIGEYMEVTDVKGVLIHNQLFSGADLASNFVPGGGKLGTYDNPTALGHEMVAAVRARLGLDSDDTARTLIGLAYEYGQLSYTNANNYSNYIGWYANAAGKFLGFYHEGVTILPEATGNPATDPAFVIKSYGYLGEVDESHGVSESDMMYATVQVRENIASGEQLVTFAVPAALIPIVTYNVALDESGDLSDLTASGADHPIRLVYEVALADDINSFNIKEKVSAAYLADPYNINADGSINFYTNQWDHQNTTGYGTVNPYAYFNPSRQNEKYYYLEDTPVYADTNGTLYISGTKPSDTDTLFRAYTRYTKTGAGLSTEIIYRELSDASKATALPKGDGSWYVPKGNVHVNTDGYTVDKSQNLTQTLEQVLTPFVDTHNHSVNDAGYNFYVGSTLGNNGKLTVMPASGIKLTKTMADGATAPNGPFAFTLTNVTSAADNTAYPAWIVKADGTEADTTVKFTNGVATVELNPDDVLYIGGMTAGSTFHIEENETVAYYAESIGLSATGTVTVSSGILHPVTFVNSDRTVGNLTIAKEVEHDFGVDYQIPADKVFTMTVTLSGIGTANATFKAEHTNGQYTEITTDANGRFTVSLKHDEQFEVFDLPEGTVATVVENNPGAGFTSAYWDNGVLGDGVVTVSRNSTVYVLVINDYEAAEVYPVNINVSGNKTLSGRAWQASDRFEFKLEKFLDDGSWQQLGDIVEAYDGKTGFHFADAFKNEHYTQPGIYYYRVVEIEPATPIGGISYDKTVHSFAVVVNDVNMDGQLEITDVRTSRPDTTSVTQTTNGWDVLVNFTNTYSTTGIADVTIDVNKVIQNSGGSGKTLAGYTFGLFDLATGNQLGDLLTTTERGFVRFVLHYDAAEIGPGNKTYSYILKEIVPASVPAGWTYSTDEILVTVQVIDNGDGTISAVIYTGNGQPTNAGTSISTTFTNIYNPDDAELVVDFVNKELSGRDLADKEFTFAVQTQNGVTVLEGTNDIYGKVTFDDTLKFDKVGVYSYDIVETSADGNGVVTDKTVYRVIVTVTDVDGKLQANYALVSVSGNTITFKNTYKATSIENIIDGTKKLNGRILLNDEFTFVLKELTVDGAAVQNPASWTVRNFADGSFAFPAIAYDKAGTYVYSVEEVIPTSDTFYGIAYDKTQYKVTVVVKDDGSGHLYIDSETVTLLDNTPAIALVFENNYTAASTSTQFTGDKQLTGNVNGALLGGEFEFELYNSDSSWNIGSLRETVANSAGGVITFNKIDFTVAGNQYFIVVEKNGGQTIDGVTYDDTMYYVLVEVTDDLMGQLHAKVHIYDNESIPQDKISFVNVYEVTGSANVTLSGEKVLDGRDFNANDSFSFELYEADDSFHATNTPKFTADMDPATHQYQITLNYTAQDLGETFYYVLKEKNAGLTIDGVTYSDVVYQIKIEVKDDGKGGIETIVTIQNATVSTLNFVNKYTVAVGTSVQLEGTKELNGSSLVDNMFTFDLIESDANWTEGAVLQSKGNVSDRFTFETIDYNKPGDYYYLVVERSGGQTISGITYDDAVYRVHVKVTDNQDGTLSSTVVITDAAGNNATIAFVNEYTVTGTDSVELSGEKVLTGREWNENDRFVFEIYEADQSFGNLSANPVTTTVADPSSGKFTLGLTFTAQDLGKTFYYVVKEQNAGKTIDGITYSSVNYHVVVTVSDNGAGAIDATARVIDGAVDALDFTNVYKAEKTFVGFDGTKILDGIRELEANDFTFDLYRATENFRINGAAIQSVKNKGDGSFSFADVEFTAAGTYRFIIKENSQLLMAGVTYDDAQYRITVTIVDNGKGKLEPSEISMVRVRGARSNEVNAITFVNTYNVQNANVTISGHKTLNGRDLEEGEFMFLLYSTNSSFAIPEGATAMLAQNRKDGTFSFDALSFAEEGTYYFVVVEDSSVKAERVVYDGTVYFVTIKIADDGNGNLVASDTVIMKSGSNRSVDAIEFVNVYVPKPADITVDIDILKTVINKGTDTITAEGFEFLLEALADGVDGITLRSDKDGKAKVTLTFTADDIGKTFVYKLTEVKGDRAHVQYSTAVYAFSISISLNAENKLVATVARNGVTVDTLTAEFENVYDYTPELPLDPDNPPTGGNDDLTMWFTLLFVSGGTMMAISSFEKKRKRILNK